MFNQSCRFVGYRGIGVELVDHSIENKTPAASDVPAI